MGWPSRLRADAGSGLGADEGSGLGPGREPRGPVRRHRWWWPCRGPQTSSLAARTRPGCRTRTEIRHPCFVPLPCKRSSVRLDKNLPYNISSRSLRTTGPSHPNERAPSVSTTSVMLSPCCNDASLPSSKLMTMFMASFAPFGLQRAETRVSERAVRTQCMCTILDQDSCQRIRQSHEAVQGSMTPQAALER